MEFTRGASPVNSVGPAPLSSSCSRLGGILFSRDAVQIHISSMKDSCPRREGPADSPTLQGGMVEINENSFSLAWEP